MKKAKTQKQIAQAIILHARKSHVEWLDFVRRTPTFDTSNVGGIRHHQRWIKNYDIVLDVLDTLEAVIRQER